MWKGCAGVCSTMRFAESSISVVGFMYLRYNWLLSSRGVVVRLLSSRWCSASLMVIGSVFR